MSTATVPRIASGSDPQLELQHELAHIRDLVFVRDLLEVRGADSTELGEYDTVIDEARVRLAESTKRSLGGYADAA